jgi:hypothetical protein
MARTHSSASAVVDARRLYVRPVAMIVNNWPSASSSFSLSLSSST